MLVRAHPRQDFQTGCFGAFSFLLSLLRLLMRLTDGNEMMVTNSRTV